MQTTKMMKPPPSGVLAALPSPSLSQRASSAQPMMPSQRASSSAAPKRATTALSVTHALANGMGTLHAGTLPKHALEGLRKECSRTACDAIHLGRASFLFDPATFGLLHQQQHSVCGAAGAAEEQTAIMKLADGYVVFAPNCGDRILSIVKDAHMCVPEGAPVAPIAPDGSHSVFYSIATHPSAACGGACRSAQLSMSLPHSCYGPACAPLLRLGAPPAAQQAFKLVFHDGYTEPHEISRFSLANHAIAQMAAAIPLDVTPRVILQSDNLGALFGQSLVGEDADLIKRAFLGLVAQAPQQGCSVYETPIETSEQIANLLQLRTRSGRISLTRLQDGILGFRPRKDGRHAFIFVANSNDFHADAPAPVDRSVVHVYKMLYKDAKPQGLRIFVNLSGDAPAAAPAAQPQQPQQPQACAAYSNNGGCAGGAQGISAGMLMQMLGSRGSAAVACPNSGNSTTMITNNILSNNNTTATLPTAPAAGAGAGCPYGTPPIQPDAHTVQNVLGLIEMAIRASGRDHAGAGEFPAVCAAEAMQRMQSGEPMDPVTARATQALLMPAPQAPSAAAAPQEEYAPPAAPQAPPQAQAAPQYSSSRRGYDAPDARSAFVANLKSDEDDGEYQFGRRMRGD